MKKNSSFKIIQMILKKKKMFLRPNINWIMCKQWKIADIKKLIKFLKTKKNIKIKQNFTKHINKK
jgi:hypothetical protein